MCAQLARRNDRLASPTHEKLFFARSRLSLSLFPISIFFLSFYDTVYTFSLVHAAARGHNNQLNTEKITKEKKNWDPLHTELGVHFYVRIYTISYSLYKSVFSGACLVSMDEREGGIDRSPTRVQREKHTRREKDTSAESMTFFSPSLPSVSLFLFYFFLLSLKRYLARANKQTNKTSQVKEK